MKFNKIFAAGLAVAMLASASIANAALVVEENDSYTYVATELPTKDEVKANQINLTITPKKLETQAAVKSASAASFSNNHSISDFNVYTLTYKLTGLGDLFNGFNADDTRVFTGISNVKIQLDTDKISSDNMYVKAGHFPGGTSKFTIDNSGYRQLLWSTSDAENPYPKYADDEVSIYNEDATAEFTTVVAIPVNTVVDITKINCVVTYVVGESGAGIAVQLNNTDDKVTVPTSLTIGEATKPETIGVDATLLVSNDVAQEGITTNGYIWKVDLTNAAAISDFKATFKAGEENAERKIRNMQALTDAMGGKGTYSFNVGLNTKKTGVTAKFEVTDGTNTAVWPAE